MFAAWPSALIFFSAAAIHLDLAFLEHLLYLKAGIWYSLSFFFHLRSIYCGAFGHFVPFFERPFGYSDFEYFDPVL